MLTEKDYCDYDTCVALKELGYKVPTSAYYMPNNNQLIFVSNPFRGGYVIDCFYSYNSFPKNVMTSNYIDAPTMWEAQKWLREEKRIIIEATFNLMYKGQPRFNWRVLYNLAQHKGAYYTLDSVNSKEDYDSFEEALSEGIKKAVKILKENES